MPIIQSLLDTDLYKLTMQQIVYHQFSSANVEYEFRLRNYPKDTLVLFRNDIAKEIDHLCTLSFADYELDYLRKLPYMTKEYIDFLRYFKLKREDIFVYLEDNEFKIFIQGSWLNTILFEVPVLAIVNEIYFKSKFGSVVNFDFTILNKRLWDKVDYIKKYGKSLTFTDFGTRRRFSRLWQDRVVDILSGFLPNNFIGTSNVYFARTRNIDPIGTMAHEYIQAMQGIMHNDRESLRYSQHYALFKWLEEYQHTSLCTALSDTLGMDAFLRDFDYDLARRYTGVRQDSGDPYEWCNKLLDHYERLGIDPKNKYAVFSDGLTPEKAIDINIAFSDQINCVFGIGTNLTNDNGVYEPMQIVIKMTKCNERPVAKIPDSPGKQMCNDEKYLAHLSSIFNINRK